MSIDVASVIDQISFLLVMGIYAIVIYRGLQMGRSFTSPLYRYRAYWMVGLSAIVLIGDMFGHVPILDSLNVGGLPLSIVLLPATVFAIYAFVDISVLTAQDMDFFHRNTLHWRGYRTLGFVVLFAEGAFLFVIFSLLALPIPPGWVTAVANSVGVSVEVPLVYGLALGYSTVALIVAARRTADITYKRHLRLLGLVLLVGTAAILNDFTIGFTPMDDLTAVLGAYIYYRATMTLSPISRVENDLATSVILDVGNQNTSLGPQPI